ncbi:MAG: Type IV pilus assembly protein PilM [Candidatus Kaiserbacteria bacterium GW2011_GWB1_52_6]|uniref:Type IV pilus assembly protein PilM n=3 Tax=Candidatus Kaiseribacteriota TaxID=1752734 RepID=A0A0G2ACI5_9BACT|nr:MAG: Type IV pilus assembly protein PilM [Candidatus Kaiserbacteria bacterium GW2011_GWA2_52_12]KKW27744.1 MAG: Type IV pilus assembly protein PilM [Candidatus Kaiserbacteria bacterium GW2011_GWB1_52_6]KKW30119.1 MAG: Type IV pilus assembly protein PilM [Candidatus Kaiserbacteria bacterium GW2011_GWC2_52_8b]
MAFSVGNLVKDITASFGKKGGTDSVLGIDIGASSIKVVQLRSSRGTAVLETYGEIALGPYGKQAVGKVVKLPPETIAEALTDLMREANVTARVAGISIPFSSSLITVLDLPKVAADAMKRMIPIEARKYIPVPIAEVTLDWSVLPPEEGKESAFDQLQGKPVARVKGQEVLLVAIHNDILATYQNVSANAGITVSFYEIDIFSTIRSSLGHGIAPFLLVDLGAATTKIYVVERGIVRLTHLMSEGGMHATEILERSMGWEFEKAERVKRERGLIDSTAYSGEENEKIKSALLSTLSRVFSEVNRVLLSYGQRYNKNVSRVVLTGGGASFPGLAPIAKTSLSAEVEIANPFAYTEAPAFLDDVLRQIGPGFTVAVGLALRKLKHN